MAHEILLNKEIFHLTEGSLPCLVHYKEKAGGSQFTVTLVADLFLRGAKILFLTAYPMARDNFYEQTKGMESEILFAGEKEDLTGAEKFRAIILKSGDQELYLEALKSLKDLDERIVLVKNFEVFNQGCLDQSIKLEKVILSGDLDRSEAKQAISEKTFKTIILFSNPETLLPIKAPELEKYVGYLKTAYLDGLVQLKI